MPLFGSHLSIAGGMVNALDEAARLGLESVQVFTKNQQQWKVRPLGDDEVRAWHTRATELGWCAGQPRMVAHASYLINLASPDDELWRKSIDLMTVEIERCETLGIGLLVHHPGAYTTSTREAGLARLVAAYSELLRRTAGFATVSCLENTVGSGSHLGATFEELAALREMIVASTGQPGRIGYCIDTCHAHAAGYDLSKAASARSAISLLGELCGFEHVRVLHLNDSKGACGSRRDLHEHIGKGTIGEAGFRAVLNERGLAGRPMIMETPKGQADDGTSFDSQNLDRLRGLLRRGTHPKAGGGRTTGRTRAS